MDLEISTFKISKEGTTLELTADEAKDLYKKLNDHFGIIMDFKTSSGKTIFNGETEISMDWSKTSQS